jgi:alkaline phosphatase D
MKTIIRLLIAATLIMCATTALAAPKEPQYKRQTVDLFTLVVDGEYEEAIATANALLKGDEEHVEALFILSAIYAQQNDIEQAMTWVRKSLKAGLPFDRYVAGPRSLFQPLTQSEAFQKLASEVGERLVHGPTLGSMTDTSVQFWLRTAVESEVAVVLDSGEKSESVRTKRETDYTAILRIEGLAPDTEYTYHLQIDDTTPIGAWPFRTFPAEAQAAKLSVAFGGGAGYTPKYEHMWNTIAKHQPDAMLLLGDNVYMDHPEHPEVQDYCYYRRQSRPEFRALAATTPVSAIWDDHDFGDNDCWGGAEINQPAWKIPVWKKFRNNWNNPYYGGGEKQPGVWFHHPIADVDFIFLDSRYYRENPNKPGTHSMLGPVQKQWLFDALKAAKGTFKVLASPVPWSPDVKPGSKDTWDGFAEEREAIFQFIADEGIEGVVLISADRHRSDIRRMERPGAYPLHEFESSKLTNIHTHKLIPGALFGYNEKCSFALMEFDTTQDDPQLTWKIFSIDNEEVYKLTLIRSQLTLP